MADNVRGLVVNSIKQYHGRIKDNLVPAHSSTESGKILSVNSSGQLIWVNRVSIYSGDGVPNNSLGNEGDLYLQTD